MLNAKFYADFSSFYKEVQKAEGHLKGFEADADKTGKALDKMVDQLSGRKVLEQATIMSKAVGEIGGVAKLTEAELRKVASTVGEATEKLQRNLQPVPKEFEAINKAAADLKQPTESWGSTISTVTTLVQGLLALKVVQWFKQAADAAIEWAGGLARAHAQTDISYRDLQVLQDVAIETSTDMSSLTKSVQVLQERIGDRTARQGIQNLGLSFDAILQMNPSQQFIAIARAISAIPDPTERARRAHEVFGNAYRETLPAMRANWDEIQKNTTIVEDGQIEAIDRMAARWSLFWNNQVKKAAAAGGAILDAYDKGTAKQAEQDLKDAEKLLIDFGQLPAVQGPKPSPLPKGLGGYGFGTNIDPSIIATLQIGNKTLDEQTKAVIKNADAKKDAERIEQKYNDALANNIERMRYGHFQLEQSAVAVSKNAAGFQIARSEVGLFSRDFSKTLTESTIHLDSFGKVVAKDVTPTLRGLGNEWNQAFLRGEVATDNIATTTSNFFKNDFNKIIASSIQGGGNPVKAALTGFGQSLFTANSSLTKTITGGVTKVFGSEGMAGKIAGQIGSMVPIIGSFIGPAIQGITALMGKVFGKSEETKSVSPLRDEFFKLQGGLETLNPKVQALGGSLELVQAVFDAKTVDAYNTAIGQLNALFQQEQDALATLTQTAEKYGLTIEELGPAMQRQQLDKQAQQLYKDWQVLNAAGIQTEVITTRMSSAINKYVQDAVQMGVEVPSAMQPMIEKMIQAGQLTDANGNKINTLEDAGITFALTMSEGFKALITSVEKLADVLSRSLGTALDTTKKKIDGIPDTIDVGVNYTDNNPPHGQSGHVHVPGYATGTQGKFVDFGAGTLAMLHGKEAIVPEGATRTIGGTSAVGGASVTIHVNAQGSFFDTPGDLQRLADKVNDALTAKLSLRNRARAA